MRSLSIANHAAAEYVPSLVIEDYNEACAIERLSPKVLRPSHAALQGILRDHYKVKERTFFEEIKAVEKRGDVEPAFIDALHSVREVGNIGAHMQAGVTRLSTSIRTRRES